AILFHTYRRKHRNKVAVDQHIDHAGVHTGHFTHMTNIENFRREHFRRLVGHGELACANQLPVFPGEANGLAAVAIDEADNLLVDRTAEHHFHHIHGGRVSHAHTIDEFRFDTEFLQELANLRAAAVHRSEEHTSELQSREK